MTTPSVPKLLPRNVSALRRGRDPSSATRITIGNPVSTRLESGIGNFFPGLECDMRNLERRFFPFLEVDTDFSDVVVAAVDLAGAAAAVSNGVISVADLENYRTIQLDVGQGGRWSVRTIAGDFGPLGVQSVTLSGLSGLSFGEGRLPPDAWVAIRLLKEQSLVTLTLGRTPGPGLITLTGPRTRYLDDDGALSRLFEPGELTQSLCSPWTHDFRDCACFYWASNHPDIALPPLPDSSTLADAPEWNLDTAWERADRSLTTPPVVTAANGSPSVPAGSTAVLEMQHHEINRDWQLLNFVLERRERVAPYQTPAAPKADPFPNMAALLAQLRYAAGVELAVMLEYLSAAWSLRQDVGAMPQALRDDVRAAFAEIRRIAIGEMRHVRTVNDLIAGLSPASAFEPALAVAAEIPLGGPGQFQPLQYRPAEPATIDDFITIEAPSQSVDGLYARVYETLVQGGGSEEQIQSVRTLMSEGGDHFQTFLFVKEWLGRHTPPSTYLITDGSADSPAGATEHQTLQQRFIGILNGLYDGYKARIPAGAGTINAARASMLGQAGIEGALDAIAAKGLLVKFEPVSDPRFAPIPHP
jgi:Ferritin-like